VLHQLQRPARQLETKKKDKTTGRVTDQEKLQKQKNKTRKKVSRRSRKVLLFSFFGLLLCSRGVCGVFLVYQLSCFLLYVMRRAECICGGRTHCICHVLHVRSISPIRRPHSLFLLFCTVLPSYARVRSDDVLFGDARQMTWLTHTHTHTHKPLVLHTQSRKQKQIFARIETDQSRYTKKTTRVTNVQPKKQVKLTEGKADKSSVVNRNSWQSKIWWCRRQTPVILQSTNRAHKKAIKKTTRVTRAVKNKQNLGRV